MNFNKAILLGAMVSAITACGSGSSDAVSAKEGSIVGAAYTGSEQAATLSENNKAAFSDAVTAITLLQGNNGIDMNVVYSMYRGVLDTLEELDFSGNEESVRVMSSNIATQDMNAANLKAMTASMRDKLELQATLPAGIAMSEIIESECGGTVTATGDITDTETGTELEYTNEYSVSATLTFNDFCIGQNSEFSNGILNGTVTIEESETETSESVVKESKLSVNNLEVINKLMETGDILDRVTLTARLTINSDQNTEAYSNKMKGMFNITTSDNETVSFNLSESASSEDGEEMSISFKAANGKTYQSAYMMRDQLIFEPAHGYVLVSDNSIRSCSDSYEGPGPLRMILEAEPAENVEGYTGSTTLEDEAGNTLVITYGSEESPCSLEPTSAEFTLATISEAPLEEA